MRRLLFGLFAATLVTFPIAANAEERTVPAGRTSGLYDFAVWDPSTCSHLGKITHRLTKPPKHGTVTTTWAVSHVESIPARCKGKIKGLLIYYTPKKGYRGPDTFTMTMLAPRFEGDGSPAARVVKPKLVVK